LKKYLPSLSIITFQKLKNNSWKVFSFGIILLFAFNSLTTSTENKIENPNKQTQTFDFLPLSTTNQIIKHDYYTLSYNEKYEQAEWVAYELKKNMLETMILKDLFS